MSHVAAVILAAGASSRLGEPKQLAMLGGERLLERAVRVAVAAGCAPVIVVLGAHAARIATECALEGATVAVNEDWAEGLASSIRGGVAAVARESGDGLGGVILMTCDQPAVTAEHLALLVAGEQDVAVASAYSGRNGVPAFFPVRTFSELMGLRGEEGARRLLGSAAAIALTGGEVDVDTPVELERARAQFNG